MESAARRHQWAEAESALSHAVTARLMDSEAGRHNRAALRIAVSRNEAMNGNNDAALQAAEQAARQAPDWLPTTINLAERLAASDHRRAALRVVERAWKTTPHPQLAGAIRTLFPDALNAYKQLEKICRVNEGAVESHIALADAALNADIWGEARRHLTASVNDHTATQGVYKMLARLERRQHGDERAASVWLTKAAEAPADPTWLCRQCGGTHSDWSPVCSHCGSFDSMEWQSVGKSRGRMTPQIGTGIGNDHD